MIKNIYLSQLFGQIKKENNVFSNYLIQLGADIHLGEYLTNKGDYRKNDGKEFQFAVRKGHYQVVKYLVGHGIWIHVKNDEALRVAAKNRHLKIVKLLIKNGANIRAKNDEALRVAAENGDLGMVKFLVKNGANVHANNNQIL